MNYRYSMNINWSDEDQVFIVSLPEFGPYANTHGTTYKEAVRQGTEALELLIESFLEEGRVLPKPRKYSPSKSKRKGKKKQKVA